MQNLLGIISFAGFIAFVAAFSSGVPPTASVCKQMLPGHHSTLLTTTPECFLNVSSAEIKSGNALTVTLTAVGENVFKGYYIQARNEENTPIGTFTPTEITKAHSCGGIRNNAAHHSGNTPKKSVPIVWKAPAKYTGTVTFLASCVKDYSNYWIGIKSSPVKIEA